MFRYLTSALLAATMASAFIVHSPTGPASSDIVCDSYASVSWDAADMPAGTDHYDVSLLLAANHTLVANLVKAFPQDNPPVGFANFYPSAAAAFPEPGLDFVISVTARGKEGEVLEVAYSPVFALPACPVESTVSSGSEVSSDLPSSASASDVSSGSDGSLSGSSESSGDFFQEKSGFASDASDEQQSSEDIDDDNDEEEEENDDSYDGEEDNASSDVTSSANSDDNEEDAEDDDDDEEN